MGTSPRDIERQKSTLAALPAVGSVTKAMKAGGYAQSTASKQQRRTMKAILGRPESKALLQRGKISDQRLAGKLSSLLDAQTVAGKDAVPVPDNSTQLSNSVRTQRSLDLRA
jgi:hypothetical protein